MPSRISSTESFYIVAEKILSHGELIPEGWPIAGTTGYGFLNDVNGLFVDPAGQDTLRSDRPRLDMAPAGSCPGTARLPAQSTVDLGITRTTATLGTRQESNKSVPLDGGE